MTLNRAGFYDLIQALLTAVARVRRLCSKGLKRSPWSCPSCRTTPGFCPWPWPRPIVAQPSGRPRKVAGTPRHRRNISRDRP
jgi:hypothetical protein